jgi:hypothetical protein
MARFRNHCCSGNTTLHYVCVVELHVTVNYIKILSVASQCFYGKIYVASGNKTYVGLHV